MAEVTDVYKCNVCGHIIEVIHAGSGDLVCCGENMQHMKENTTDAAQEKHVPVKEKDDEGLKVKVGSTAHPMEEEHYIEWVQVIHEGWVCRKFLHPGENPEAVFCKIPEEAIAREYCNKHGLWKG